MTLRCDCSDAEDAAIDGGWRDPYVFGPCITCATGRIEPERREHPRLVPSWMFVVPHGQYGALSAAARQAARRNQEDLADERPYEQTLDPDERCGR